MSDTATATTAATAAATAATTATTTATPWHTGIDAETVGWWQNKGYKVEDPKEVVTALSKSYRELERHMGGGPENLIRIPKPDAKPDDIKAFWQKIGAPADPKEYDLSAIKFAGEDLDPAFSDAIRSGLAAAFVPKDRAHAVVKAVVDFLESADKAESATTTAKIGAEKADLAKEWGPNFDFNHLKAMEGARRLGITPEAVKALEGQIGYKAVMEAMRKIGAGTSEDTFVDGNRGANGAQVTTREGAMARKKALEADRDWGKRYLAGGIQENQEMIALITMIDGTE